VTKEVNSVVHVIDNPYLQEMLTRLRDKNTSYVDFRKILEELGYLLGIELSRSLTLEEVYVETPLRVKARGIRIKDVDNIVLIAILRASLPFIWGLLKAYPKAKLGIIVARRVEEHVKYTSEGMVFDVEISYENTPYINENTVVIIADPMIATGSTIRKVLLRIRENKPKKVIIVSVIATNYAIKRISEVYDKIEFYTLSIDKELDSRGYIIPGLGDAGDRSFGTP